MEEFVTIAGDAAAGAMSLTAIWRAAAADFADLGSPAALGAFGQVLMIDVMLAGDNAIVVGALAAGLPAGQRRRVILIGIGAALVLRILFALAVTQLLRVVGLILAGGLILLWVAWRMWRDLRHQPEATADAALRTPRSFARAAWAVAIADVSMSLDNVLAVAGAARDHPGVLVIGLLLSVGLMGVAANILSRYIERYRWIGYLGLGVIVYVAVKMIYEGLANPAVGVLQLFD